MPACSAYGCTNRENKNGITLHRFPKDPSVRQKWIDALRRKDFMPSKSAVVCSAHFEEKDLDRTSLCYVRVREGAVPSQFMAFPAHLKKKPSTRKLPKPRVDESVPAMLSAMSKEPPTVTAQQPDSPTTANIDDVNFTPRKQEMKRKLEEMESSVVTITQKLTSSRKKVKMLQQSKRRLMKRNAALKNVIDDLHKNNLMRTDSSAVLKQSAGGVADLLQRQIGKKLGSPLPASYSAELRSFALTLHFYSPRAYRYVRKIFDTCLPHPRTIEKWYRSVDGKPGFTFNSIRVLEDPPIYELGGSISLLPYANGRCVPENVH